MSKILATAAIVLTLGSLSLTGAHADEVFTFTGVITDTGGLAGVNVGDTYTQVFTVKSGAFDYIGAPVESAYFSADGVTPGDVIATTTFGGYTFTSNALTDPNAFNTLLAIDAYPADPINGEDGLSAEAQGFDQNGFTDIDFGTILASSGPDTGSDPIDQLRPGIHGPGFTDLSQWDIYTTGFSAYDADGNNVGFNGELTSVTAVGDIVVPEPAPIAAFGIGLLGLCALGFRARKRQSRSA